MAQYAHLSNMTKEIAAAVATLPTPPLTSNVSILRIMFNAIFKQIAQARKDIIPPDNEYKVFDKSIPVDGSKIRVRCLVPASRGTEDVFPVLVWLHGGGHCLGTIDMDDFWLRRWCVDLRISIVIVGYRLAPEHPFPVDFNDSYEALKWATLNAPLLSASPKKGLIIAGCSAGANLSASISLRARDDPFFKDAPVTGTFLQVPRVVHHEVVPEKYKSEYLSWEQNKDAPILSRATSEKFAEWLKLDPSDPLYSPLLAPTHAGLPPTFLQICGFDPLRDEGILYEKVLREQSVKTKIEIYPGLPHSGNAVFFELDISKKYEKDAMDGVRWLLRGGSDWTQATVKHRL